MVLIGQRSGRRSEVNDDNIKTIIESNRPITVREITKQLKSQLKRKPLKLQIHLIIICDTHFKCYEVDLFIGKNFHRR